MVIFLERACIDLGCGGEEFSSLNTFMRVYTPDNVTLGKEIHEKIILI